MSEEYHKINTLYKRDMENKKRLLVGEWSTPEFEYLQNNDWEFTEKVDGTNIRVEINRVEDSLYVDYDGRTNSADIPPHLYKALTERFGHSSTPADRSHEFLNSFGPMMVERGITKMTLYGEGYGPKIQGGGKYRDTPDFVLFDVKVGSWWLTRDSVEDLAYSFDIPLVPLIGYGTLSDAVALVTGDTSRRVEQRDEYGEYHKVFVNSEFKSTWGDFEAEGIVARPVVPMFDRKGERIIAKIKVRDFR